MRPCASCDNPLLDDQRYCLTCGTPTPRAARAPLGTAPARAASAAGPPAASVAAAVAPAAGAAPAGVLARWGASVGGPVLRVRVPGSRRVSEIAAPVAAAAVVAMLLGGVALGSATEGGSAPTRTVDLALRAPDAAPGAPPAGTAPPVPLPPPLPPLSADTVPSGDLPPLPDPIAPAFPADPAPLPPSDPLPAAPADDGEDEDAPAEESTPEPGDEATGGGDDDASPVDRVLVVALAGQPADALFGAAAPPYLRELAATGTVLSAHHAVAPGAAANGVALLSGQGPTPEIVQGCPARAPIAPATIDDDGQELGAGCTFSVQTPTITSQLDQVPKSWMTLTDGLAAPCTPPAPGLPDALGGRYVAGLFAAVLESESCAQRVLPMADLAAAYADADTAPAYAFVTPAVADAATADAWLRAQLAPALATEALSERALVVVTQLTGDPADVTRCCSPRSFPNLPGATPGGGKVGALLIGAGIEAGKVDPEPSNHFGLLRLTEDLLGLDPLGYAKTPVSAELAERLLAD